MRGAFAERDARSVRAHGKRTRFHQNHLKIHAVYRIGSRLQFPIHIITALIVIIVFVCLGVVVNNAAVI